jgi:porin
MQGLQEKRVSHWEAAGHSLNKGPTKNEPDRTFDNFRLPYAIALSTLCIAMVLSRTAMAQSTSLEARPNAPHVKAKKTAHVKFHKAAIPHHLKPAVVSSTNAISLEDAANANVQATSPARLDTVYGLKGWDFPFTSFGDTLLQDYGGWRSTLAKYGFGLIATNITLSSINMLNVPTNGPGAFNGQGQPIGRQQYWGQRPSLSNNSTAYLTYDMSQYGIPDGQIQIIGQGSWASSRHEEVNKLSTGGIAWYQTLFNKALEIKVGLVSNGVEWLGAYVGGNFASPFGESSFIPYEMGNTILPAVQPTARATWHITDTLYDEFGIMRSMPVNGPTGDIFYDDAHYNPTGFRFSVPNGRVLAMNELGYKNPATPGVPGNWLRFGVQYNSSKFANYQTGGTTTGVGSMYFLADRQLWQVAPQSPFTAYRGVYAGVSAMYAPPENNAFSQYYEARLYYVGPFDSRPTDQIGLVYSHNVFSRYIAALVNDSASGTGIYGRHSSNSLTATYTAHLMPGVYWTMGVGYTDHPSIMYTKTEGSALNFLAGLVTAF